MFPDLSWSHMLLVLVVALVVVGPKDLPGLMRKMGQWVTKARGMADQFRNSFDEMARQSELDELRKEIDELRKVRPLADVQEKVEEAMRMPEISLSPDPSAATKEPDPEIVHEPPPADPEPQQPIDEGLPPPAEDKKP